MSRLQTQKPLGGVMRSCDEGRARLLKPVSFFWLLITIRCNFCMGIFTLFAWELIAAIVVPP